MRTSKRPLPTVPSTDDGFRKPVINTSDVDAFVSLSATAETSMRTRVLPPSVRMTLCTSASASDPPEALAAPETETPPPVSEMTTFSTVSAFAGLEAATNASKTEIRSILFMSGRRESGSLVNSNRNTIDVRAA